MNRIKSFVLICVSIIFVFSCKEKSTDYKGLKFQDIKKTDFNYLNVDVENLKSIDIPSVNSDLGVIKSSQLIDTSYVIPLETLSKNLIGHIDEVKIYKNEIFVSDIRKSKSVYVFDLRGKYLRRIGDIGSGPGEYSRPEGFEIDEKNNELLVFNGNIRKILRYNLSGEFLGNIDIGFGCKSFKVLDDGNILLLAADYENTHLGEIKDRIVYVINRKGKIVEYGPKRSSDFKKVAYNLPNNLTSKNQEITYSYRFSDTIYKVSNNKINAKFHINFGDEGINREKMGSKNQDEFVKMLKDAKKPIPYFPGKHFQTNDYLYFTFIYNGKAINCFYNKNNSELIIGSSIDNKNSPYPFFSSFCSSYEDYFISSVDAYDFIQFKKVMTTLDPSIKDNLIIKQLNNLGIDAKDNPILFFYKIKKSYDEN